MVHKILIGFSLDLIRKFLWQSLDKISLNCTNFTNIMGLSMVPNISLKHGRIKSKFIAEFSSVKIINWKFTVWLWSLSLIPFTAIKKTEIRFQQHLHNWKQYPFETLSFKSKKFEWRKKLMGDEIMFADYPFKRTSDDLMCDDQRSIERPNSIKINSLEETEKKKWWSNTTCHWP